MLFPPQHLRGPVPARHFAASQLPRAGDGVSSTIFTLLPPVIPALGCCTHREATQLSTGAGDAAFLRSHLHVLPRRPWTGLSHHVQDVTLVPLVMGLVMGSPLEKLYDNSTVLVTCPCSSHGGAEAGQDTPAPRAGDSLWLPTGTECSLWAHTQQEVTPSPAWHSCRLANYRNNCTRPPAQAAAGHSGSEASPTGSLGTLGDTGHISSAPSGSVRPEELHQEILLLSMKTQADRGCSEGSIALGAAAAEKGACRWEGWSCEVAIRQEHPLSDHTPPM